MKDEILSCLKKAVSTLEIETGPVALDYPENIDHGDFSTNIALIEAKKSGMSPKVLADKIVAEFEKGKPDFVTSASIAGPGFINFSVKDEVYAEEIVKIAKRGAEYPVSKSGEGNGEGKKVMVEYTDPNPFKEFHIGHLMSNAIGESISRLIETDGTRVIRANWQGDVGPHVAKAVWGAMHAKIKAEDGSGKASFWGKAYAQGATAYETDDKAKQEIEEINKKIYAKSDPEIGALYEKGRKESLEAFESIYKRLDTKFDNYFFEGAEGRNGEVIVKEFLKRGIFEESDGAIIFRGENHGLHTRVFITSHGLPTYETKELGLNTEKFKLYPDLSQSIIITGNEQSDYFRVLIKVFSLIDPDIAAKTRHLSHGLMRFASGKMSSRKGNVVSAEALIDEVKEMVKEKMEEGKRHDGEESSKVTDRDEIADMIAIAAIKYTILRQSVGSDVIFDSVKSISFEGDSGPYLQYSAVRANAVLEKAKREGMRPVDGSTTKLPERVALLERLIVRFPDIIERARSEYAPQLVATHLINLAGAFNSFYASQVIIDKDDSLSPYRLVLTEAFLRTMTNGLRVLGIKVPNKM